MDKSRLDDHSKRLQALEAAQIHFANQQADIIKKLSRVSEVLFGSDNPNEVSMKNQVKDTNDMVREIKKQFEEAQKETVTIRTEGFGRLTEIERWRREEIDTDRKEKKGTIKQYVFWGVTFAISEVATIMIALYILGGK